MKRVKIIAVIFFVTAGVSTVIGQGCSDAGACSIQALNSQSETTAQASATKINLGMSAGAADHSILALNGSVGISGRLTGGLSAEVKATYAQYSGNEISNGGLGDIYALLHYTSVGPLSISGGVKIPLNKADATYEGRMLPMDYQSSLGTFDLIVGAAYQKNAWLVGLGLQLPLSDNENRFMPEAWDVNSPLSMFTPTGAYERKGDLLMRITRQMKLGEKMTLIAGLLPIYHLGEDVSSPVLASGTIEGSDGLTLNVTGRFIIPSGERNELHVLVGFPLIVREVRPDGLTRSVVFGVEYSFGL